MLVVANVRCVLVVLCDWHGQGTGDEPMQRVGLLARLLLDTYEADVTVDQPQSVAGPHPGHVDVVGSAGVLRRIASDRKETVRLSTVSPWCHELTGVNSMGMGTTDSLKLSSVLTAAPAVVSGCSG